MKKTAFISIILALTLLLSSCTVKIKGKGDGDTSSSESSIVDNSTEIKVNTDYTLTDGISFRLVRAESTPLILDTSGSGKGYEPYSSGVSYIDLIFDITNTSATQFDCNESMDITFERDYGYTTSSEEEDDEDSSLTGFGGTFVGENNGWASMSTFSKAIIPTNETVRVHYFITYDNTDFYQPTYNFIVKADTDSDEEAASDLPTYKFSYSPTQGTVGETAPINLKETFTIENYANITLEEVKYSTKLLPSNTWGSYTYYEVQEYGKTFLIFKFKVENLTEDVIVGQNSIHGIILNSVNVYGESYFVSSTILEESNKKDLTQAGAIEAGKTNNVYAVFEVSNMFETLNNYTVTFMAGGKFYSYSTGTSTDVSSDTASY